MKKRKLTSSSKVKSLFKSKASNMYQDLLLLYKDMGLPTENSRQLARAISDQFAIADEHYRSVLSSGPASP